MVRFNIRIQGVPASDEQAVLASWSQFAAVLTKYGWDCSYSGAPENRDNPRDLKYYFSFSGKQ
jgi:hypothetical protein